MNIRPYVAADEKAVIDLWKRCNLARPWNDPRKDIRRKLRVRPDLFLVGDIDGQVVATVMAGYEGHRGWINYLAVSPEHRRQGLGRTIMREVERRLLREGCAKINLQVRSSNREAVEFYKRVGFMVDDVISLGRRLENDDRPGNGSPRAPADRP